MVPIYLGNDIAPTIPNRLPKFLIAIFRNQHMIRILSARIAEDAFHRLCRLFHAATSILRDRRNSLIRSS